MRACVFVSYCWKVILKYRFAYILYIKTCDRGYENMRSEIIASIRIFVVISASAMIAAAVIRLLL